MPQQIIDTHIHVWDLSQADYPWLKNDTSILNRSYSIEELEAERPSTNVTEGVLVQASGNFEDTDLMLKVAGDKDWIRGVVGWLPLMDPDATQNALQGKYGQNTYFKGVRHQIHDESDSQWLLQPAVIESLKILVDNNLPFDLVGILPAHIETAFQVAEKVPGLKMVFDHLNQPPISTKETYGRWGELMTVAAKHPNFYAKISGLSTASGSFNGRGTDDMKPYVAFVLEHFGTGRCFCGGDWPVSLLAKSYAATWQDIETILSSLLTETELADVLYNNPKQFYQL
ncbi:MAG: amidohydrolase family protein [Bacteroidota bacterium]